MKIRPANPQDHVECLATIGQVGTSPTRTVDGKAGRSRWMASARTCASPTPSDEPGDNPLAARRQDSGGRHRMPGACDQGYKTRKNKYTDRFIGPEAEVSMPDH